MQFKYRKKQRYTLPKIISVITSIQGVYIGKVFAKLDWITFFSLKIINEFDISRFFCNLAWLAWNVCCVADMLASVAWLVCICGWYVSLIIVGGMFMWVVLATCLCGWRTSMTDVHSALVQVVPMCFGNWNEIKVIPYQKCWKLTIINDFGVSWQ